jgi:hypothetical protein
MGLQNKEEDMKEVREWKGKLNEVNTIPCSNAICVS